MFEQLAFLIRLVILTLVITHLASCYSPVEGCLDPEATNYSIEGDNECLDCCIYPTLDLSIFHENRDTTFTLTDTIITNLDQQISLVEFVYLLSDFTIQVGGNTLEVQDALVLNVNDEELIVKDDIIRVSRSGFTYEIGTIIFDGVTENISFKVGLNDNLNEYRFIDDIDDHPLTNDPDSLFLEDSETYVFQRLKIAQGDQFLDTVIYDITTAYDVSFPIDFESLRGKDKTIIIEAQYDEWFNDIDFNTMSKSEIEDMIGENSANIFRQKD